MKLFEVGPRRGGKGKFFNCQSYAYSSTIDIEEYEYIVSIC